MTGDSCPVKVGTMWPVIREALALVRVVGAVAGEEGGESGAARCSRLTIAGGVRGDNCTE